jgi:hypothetical protein
MLGGKRNFIGEIRDDRGQLWEIPNRVETAFVNYYFDLFTTGAEGDMELSLQHINLRVSQDMNKALLMAFTREEISGALFQMGPLKAPGPDGLTAGFFQKNWNIVGDEVCDAVFYILHTGMMLDALNLTHIVLIPKVKNPLSVMKFRPISLCNVIYKLVSKVLANRLKKILPQIISPTQSAFLLGRLISDNILATYETLHTMHTGMKGKKGFMTVKLDMSKVYDQMEWRFLEAVMCRMGFDIRWINLIMMCVKIAHYTVMVNGKPCRNITPSRGIR